jgi:hypothetical protein
MTMPSPQRIRPCAVLLIAPALLAASCAPTPPPTMAEAQKELQAIYDAQDAAIERKDDAALQANMAADFTAVTPKGRKADGPTLIGGMQHEFQRGLNFHSKSTVTNITVDGYKARATVKSRMTYEKPDYGMDVHGNHMKNTYDITTTSIDTWTKENGAWKAHEVKIFTEENYENGVAQ